MMGCMALGSLDAVVVDAPDTFGLAEFNRALLGGSVTGDEDWADFQLTPDRPEPLISFQRALALVVPTWPSHVVPQQLHIDIRVADLDEGERAALAAGARVTSLPKVHEDGSLPGFRVYLDPTGHPFCLV